jgi:hypothetical protein
MECDDLFWCQQHAPPVAGFLPLRSRFFFTQNFPKPEINTTPPVFRDCLISSSKILTVSIDLLRVNPFLSATASIMWAFVRVPDNGMVGVFFHLKTSN